MKGILEFDLPMDYSEFGHACQAGRMAGAIEEFRSWLRNQRKHGDRLDNATVEEVWSEFHAVFEGLPD